MRISHTGLERMLSGNTMLAFRKAVEVQVDGIELDLQFSKDGKLVIMHDEKLLRTTGLPGKVMDYLFEELQAVNASEGISGSFGFTPVPGFEEYCTLVRDLDIITNIELKTNKIYYPGIEEDTLEMVRAYGLDERVIFSSFNWLTVLKIRELAPHIKTALLQEDYLTERIGQLASGYGITCYHPDITLTTEQCIRDCREHGIEVNLWTVNDTAQLAMCEQWGAEGVISNRPDLLLAGRHP